MLKTISSSFALTTLCLFSLTGCSSHNEFLKASSNELVIADDCRNTNKHLEMDCYDLISYKNSFAQLRLGLNAQLRGNFEEALQRLNISKQKGNFYANAPLADIYRNGFGVPINHDLAIKLLEDNGYIYKEKTTSDKREVIIKLTDKGLKSRNLSKEVVVGFNKKVVEKIDPEKFAVFKEVMGDILKIANNMNNKK